MPRRYAQRRPVRRRRTYARRPAGYPYSQYGTSTVGNVTTYGPRGTPEGIAAYGQSYATATDRQREARRVQGWRGRGDYKSAWQGVRKWIPRLVGGAVGAFASRNPAGAMAGWNKGADFSKAVGWGDYVGEVGDGPPPGGLSGAEGAVVANQLIEGGDKPIQVNSMTQNNSGDLVFSHTEFIQNVRVTTSAAGVSAFDVVELDLNPGLTNTFPFLSQLAQNFTLYKFEGLIFQYRPNTSEQSGSTPLLGKVIMATQYDPDAPPFLNSVQMENYDYAISAKPSKDMVHGVETAPVQIAAGLGMMYVRTGETTKARSFTDIGIFQIATESVPGPVSTTFTVGELWVTYKVRVSRANLYGALLGQNIRADDFVGTADATAAILTTVPSTQNQIGCTLTNFNQSTFDVNFPNNISRGTFMVVVRALSPTFHTERYQSCALVPTNCEGALWNSITPGWADFTGLTIPVVRAPDDTTGATANTTIMAVMYIRVIAPGNAVASFCVSMTGALPNGSVYSVYITEINELMVTQS